MTADTIVLIVNLAFLAVILLFVMWGFIKGFRKTSYNFFATLVVLVILWLSIDKVVNAIYDSSWVMELLNNAGLFKNIDALGTTLRESLPAILKSFIPKEYSAIAESPIALSYVLAVVEIFLRIILYVILFYPAKWIIKGILKIFFWIFMGDRNKIRKAKQESLLYRRVIIYKKRRLLGGCMGLLRGLLWFLILVLPISGLLSVVENVNLKTEDTKNAQTEKINNLEFYGFDATDTIEILQKLRNSGFGAITSLKIGDNALDQVYFDAISTGNFAFEDENVKIDKDFSLRKELNIIVDALLKANEMGMLQDGFDMSNFEEYDPEVLKDVFTILGKSDLVTSLIPVALEVLPDIENIKSLYEDYLAISEVDSFEFDFSKVYDIDFEKEFTSLGTILGNVVSIDDFMSFDVLSWDGDEFAALINSLGSSKLLTDVIIPNAISFGFSTKTVVDTFDDSGISKEERVNLLADVLDIVWSGEFTTFSEVWTAFSDLEIKGTDEILKVINSWKDEYVDEANGITKLDKFEEMFGILVKSDLVTFAIPVAVNIGLERFVLGNDMVTDYELNDLLDLSVMGTETNEIRTNWKNDILKLVHAARLTVESGLLADEVNYDTLDSKVLKEAVVTLFGNEYQNGLKLFTDIENRGEKAVIAALKQIDPLKLENTTLGLTYYENINFDVNVKLGSELVTLLSTYEKIIESGISVDKLIKNELDFEETLFSLNETQLNYLNEAVLEITNLKLLETNSNLVVDYLLTYVDSETEIKLNLDVNNFQYSELVNILTGTSEILTHVIANFGFESFNDLTSLEKLLNLPSDKINYIWDRLDTFTLCNENLLQKGVEIAKDNVEILSKFEKIEEFGIKDLYLITDIYDLVTAENKLGLKYNLIADGNNELNMNQVYGFVVDAFANKNESLKELFEKLFDFVFINIDTINYFVEDALNSVNNNDLMYDLLKNATDNMDNEGKYLEDINSILDLISVIAKDETLNLKSNIETLGISNIFNHYQDDLGYYFNNVGINKIFDELANMVSSLNMLSNKNIYEEILMPYLNSNIDELLINYNVKDMFNNDYNQTKLGHDISLLGNIVKEIQTLNIPNDKLNLNDFNSLVDAICNKVLTIKDDNKLETIVLNLSKLDLVNLIELDKLETLVETVINIKNLELFDESYNVNNLFEDLSVLVSSVETLVEGTNKENLDDLINYKDYIFDINETNVENAFNKLSSLKVLNKQSKLLEKIIPVINLPYSNYLDYQQFDHNSVDLKEDIIILGTLYKDIKNLDVTLDDFANDNLISTIYSFIAVENKKLALNNLISKLGNVSLFNYIYTPYAPAVVKGNEFNYKDLAHDLVSSVTFKDLTGDINSIIEGLYLITTDNAYQTELIAKEGINNYLDYVTNNLSKISNNLDLDNTNKALSYLFDMNLLNKNTTTIKTYLSDNIPANYQNLYNIVVDEYNLDLIEDDLNKLLNIVITYINETNINTLDELKDYALALNLSDEAVRSIFNELSLINVFNINNQETLILEVIKVFNLGNITESDFSNVSLSNDIKQLGEVIIDLKNVGIDIDEIENDLVGYLYTKLTETDTNKLMQESLNDVSKLTILNALYDETKEDILYNQEKGFTKDLLYEALDSINLVELLTDVNTLISLIPELNLDSSIKLDLIKQEGLDSFVEYITNNQLYVLDNISVDLLNNVINKINQFRILTKNFEGIKNVALSNVNLMLKNNNIKFEFALDYTFEEYKSDMNLLISAFGKTQDEFGISSLINYDLTDLINKFRNDLDNSLENILDNVISLNVVSNNYENIKEFISSSDNSYVELLGKVVESYNTLGLLKEDILNVITAVRIYFNDKDIKDINSAVKLGNLATITDKGIDELKEVLTKLNILENNEVIVSVINNLPHEGFKAYEFDKLDYSNVELKEDLAKLLDTYKIVNDYVTPSRVKGISEAKLKFVYETLVEYNEEVANTLKSLKGITFFEVIDEKVIEVIANKLNLTNGYLDLVNSVKENMTYDEYLEDLSNIVLSSKELLLDDILNVRTIENGINAYIDYVSSHKTYILENISLELVNDFAKEIVKLNVINKNYEDIKDIFFNKVNAELALRNITFKFSLEYTYSELKEDIKEMINIFDVVRSEYGISNLVHKNQSELINKFRNDVNNRLEETLSSALGLNIVKNNYENVKEYLSKVDNKYINVLAKVANSYERTSLLKEDILNVITAVRIYFNDKDIKDINSAVKLGNLATITDKGIDELKEVLTKLNILENNEVIVSVINNLPHEGFKAYEFDKLDYSNVELKEDLAKLLDTYKIVNDYVTPSRVKGISEAKLKFVYETLVEYNEEVANTLKSLKGITFFEVIDEKVIEVIANKLNLTNGYLDLVNSVKENMTYDEYLEDLSNIVLSSKELLLDDALKLNEYTNQVSDMFNRVKDFRSYILNINPKALRSLGNTVLDSKLLNNSETFDIIYHYSVAKVNSILNTSYEYKNYKLENVKTDFNKGIDALEIVQNEFDLTQDDLYLSNIKNTCFELVKNDTYNALVKFSNELLSTDLIKMHYNGVVNLVVSKSGRFTNLMNVITENATYNDYLEATLVSIEALHELIHATNANNLSTFMDVSAYYRSLNTNDLLKTIELVENLGLIQNKQSRIYVEVLKLVPSSIVVLDVNLIDMDELNNVVWRDEARNLVKLYELFVESNLGLRDILNILTSPRTNLDQLRGKGNIIDDAFDIVVESKLLMAQMDIVYDALSKKVSYTSNLVVNNVDWQNELNVLRNIILEFINMLDNNSNIDGQSFMKIVETFDETQLRNIQNNLNKSKIYVDSINNIGPKLVSKLFNEDVIVNDWQDEINNLFDVLIAINNNGLSLQNMKNNPEEFINELINLDDNKIDEIGKTLGKSTIVISILKPQIKNQLNSLDIDEVVDDITDWEKEVPRLLKAIKVASSGNINNINATKVVNSFIANPNVFVESEIMLYAIVNQIMNEESIITPLEYRSYNDSNKESWKNELIRLANALEVLGEVDNLNEFASLSNLNKLDAKLTVNSDILEATIVNKLEEQLGNNLYTPSDLGFSYELLWNKTNNNYKTEVYYLIEVIKECNINISENGNINVSDLLVDLYNSNNLVNSNILVSSIIKNIKENLNTNCLKPENNTWENAKNEVIKLMKALELLEITNLDNNIEISNKMKKFYVASNRNILLNSTVLRDELIDLLEEQFNNGILRADFITINNKHVLYELDENNNYNDDNSEFKLFFTALEILMGNSSFDLSSVDINNKIENIYSDHRFIDSNIMRATLIYDLKEKAEFNVNSLVKFDELGNMTELENSKAELVKLLNLAAYCEASDYTTLQVEVNVENQNVTINGKEIALIDIPNKKIVYSVGEDCRSQIITDTVLSKLQF